MHFIKVKTNHSIAIDSPDHLFPWGTARDNSRNLRFNHKAYALFNFLDRFPKVLDLGCSGGGFVKSCLDDGCLSIGLEGSDYSKKHARAEWPILAEKFLFNADITYPFEIYREEKPLCFDLITAWDVMEHLPIERLKTVCENIHNHLEDHGLVILSISPNEGIVRGKKLHLTVKDKTWWVSLFESNALFHIESYKYYFNTQYVRGTKQNAPGSFHLFLSKNPSLAPSIPKLSLKEQILDKWAMSTPQKILQKILISN